MLPYAVGARVRIPIRLGGPQIYRRVMFMVAAILAVRALPAKALTLQNIIDDALKAGHASKMNRDQSTVFRAKVEQAYGAMGPQLKALGYQTKQDVSQSPRQSSDGTGLRLNLSQPILGLYKKQPVLAASSDMEAAFQAAINDNNMQLKLNIVEQYHSVLTAISDRDSYKETLSSAIQRVQETAQRVRVGRSRVSDLYAAKAQQAAAQAQYSQALASEQTARLNLAVMSGARPTIDLEDTVVLPAALEPAEYWLAFVEEHPALIAVKVQQTTTGSQLESIRRQRWPDLDLTSNYYLFRDEPLSKVKWDVGLQLTVSLFDGGVSTAQLREATAQASMVAEQVQEKRRILALKVQQNYELCASSLRQLPWLQEALKMAQKSFAAIDRDYKLGMATILEQIAASNAVAETKRQYNRQLYNAKASYLALRYNAGRPL